MDKAAKKYRVIADYQSPYPDPIIFRKGEAVTIGKEFTDDPDWKDWVWCEGQNDNQAWVPKQYLEIEADQGIFITDYNALELSVVVGEVLKLYESVNGFGMVEKQNGARGWVPLKNLQEEKKGVEKVDKRIFLFEGTLQIFIALGAVGGGLALLLDPSGQGIGFSVELLSNSPFSNYLIPGLFLFLVNGIGNFFCGFLSIKKHRYAGYAGMLVQAALLGWVSWFQPIYLFLGALELGLGFLLHKVLAGEAK